MDVVVELLSALPGLVVIWLFLLGPLLVISCIHVEAWGDVVVLPGAKLGIVLCIADILVLTVLAVMSCL